jgi:hypothetical protein
MQAPDCDSYHRFMPIENIISILRAGAGNRVRLAFSDDIVQTVVVGSVDDEGFLHSSPDCADPYAFWTRFEGVKLLEPEDS